MVYIYVMGFLSCMGVWLYDIPAGDCARRGYFDNWKTWGVDLVLCLCVINRPYLVNVHVCGILLDNAYARAYGFFALILLNLTQGMSCGR